MPSATKSKWKDQRRRHFHYLVRIIYRDKGIFSRVYTDKTKAVAFADRQKKSPIVKSAAVDKLS